MKNAADQLELQKEPEVSLIVLNYNKPELTIQCVESLIANTRDFNFEIIVVDNGSTLEGFARLKAARSKFKLLRLETNRFYGEGNNIGVEAALAPFIVLLNNDILVSPGWLEPLISELKDNPSAGATGPCFIYPSGTLQEAGAFVNENGTVFQVGKGLPKAVGLLSQKREVDYISAATLAMRKADFKAIGGFDYAYEPAYYEDVDLCLKLKSINKSTIYVPESVVCHLESQTTSDSSLGLGLHNIVEINRTKFVRKWGNFLSGSEAGDAAIQSSSPNLEPGEPDHVNKARFPESNKGLKAALYSPYNFSPGGGEKFFFEVAAMFDPSSTVLLSDEIYSDIRMRQLYSDLEISNSPLSVSRLDPSQKYDYFFALGNAIVPPSPALGIKSFFICQFPFPTSGEYFEAHREHYDGYDAVIVYSEFVKINILAEMLRMNLPLKPVIVLPPPVNQVQKNEEIIRDDKNIISVGRFFVGDHSKRQDVLIDAFRELHGRDNSFTLTLVGGLAKGESNRNFLASCKEKAHDLPVEFVVDATRKEVIDRYSKASIYWHASGFQVDELTEPEKCEHFGISVLEAMSVGVIPFVVPNGGPSSIVRNGMDGFHYESVTDLINKTMRAYDSINSIETMREHAIGRWSDFSLETFKTNFQLSLMGSD